MKTYTIKLRTKEYQIATDTVAHKDGSQSRVVFCNGRVVTHVSLMGFPKAIETALYRELGA